MLSQTAPTAGAPLSRADLVRQAARARNTQRAYLGHWNRFCSWALEQELDLPDGLEAALTAYLVHLAEEGRRMATIRQARAAIVKGAQLAGCGDRRGHSGSSVSTPTTSGGACCRPPGPLDSLAGGTSPDTRVGSGWPRTCRQRGSPSPS